MTRSYSSCEVNNMTRQSGVRLDSAVTYKVYLCHRLPHSRRKADASNNSSSINGLSESICTCRATRTIQVPKSQQHLVLRHALVQAASVVASRHHELHPASFSVVVDRAIVLLRGRRASSDQDLPGVDIRGETCSGEGDGKSLDNVDVAAADRSRCEKGMDEAVRFWRDKHGAAVPVWVEFTMRMPPAERGHAIVLSPGGSSRRRGLPRGTEVAVHQALANEEALIRSKSAVSLQAQDTVGGSTTSESSRVSTIEEESGEDEDDDRAGPAH